MCMYVFNYVTIHLCMCACEYVSMEVVHIQALGHIAANGELHGHIDPPALQAGKRSAWLVLPP